MDDDDLIRDQALCLDMLLSAKDALQFVENMDYADFATSRLHQNAVIRSLEIIGEAANKVSSDFQRSHDRIPWRRMIGMRHRLIHGYGDVRTDLVWQVVIDHLSGLVRELEKLVPPKESA